MLLPEVSVKACTSLVCLCPPVMKFWWKVKYNVLNKNQQCGLVVTGLYLELGDPWSVPGSHNDLFLSLGLHCSRSQNLLLLFCPSFTSGVWHIPSRTCIRISRGWHSTHTEDASLSRDENASSSNQLSLANLSADFHLLLPPSTIHDVELKFPA